jgi:hypothetical protein
MTPGGTILGCSHRSGAELLTRDEAKDHGEYRQVARAGAQITNGRRAARDLWRPKLRFFNGSAKLSKDEARRIVVKPMAAKGP